MKRVLKWKSNISEIGEVLKEERTNKYPEALGAVVQSCTDWLIIVTAPNKTSLLLTNNNMLMLTIFKYFFYENVSNK